MSASKAQAQSAVQAGSSGETAAVGSAVGGVRSSDDLNWLDLWAMNPETRAYLSSARRDAACSHASSRSEGAGDGPQGIATPEKLRHLQDTLYRKAKAQPGYRFWSLYAELTRHDLLEHALRLVVRNGGAPGVDGESLAHITATPQTQARWLDALQKEMQTKSYRPEPARRVYMPKSHGGQRPLGMPTVKDRVVQMAARLVLGPIAIRLVATAGASRVETTVRPSPNVPECLGMKRPGKPDTGNPFVRFDEGRSGSAELTTAVSATRLLPLRLLYPETGWC